MKLIFVKIFLFLILVSMPWSGLLAQISPGDLAQAHAHLEGLANCTKCHTLGDKVSDQKCLDCHDEIARLINADRGYHATKTVKDQPCYKCHNDHHGRNFQIIRFDADTFNHQLAGYPLEGAHSLLECQKCHTAKYIADADLKQKKQTWLGLETRCMSCHEDYHQGTLAASCLDCHNYEAFSPAPGFDHQNADFQLKGKHRETDCDLCHQTTMRNEKEFRVFTGLEYAKCTDCHTDVHNNKFGQECTQCHNEQSFHQVSDLTSIDHNQTAFPLEGKHQGVDCKSCHIQSYLEPLTHKQCLDCHEDFHGGQFIKNGQNTDCASCHSVQGFTPSSFGIDRHRKTDFPLEGAHSATPCFACHQTGERWNFKDMGTSCIDCHENIHKNYISNQYFGGQECTACHTVSHWGEIAFDHQETGFILDGAHARQQCRACHFSEVDNKTVQRFSGLSPNCTQCHTDIHLGQFDDKGNENCVQCHGFENWLAEKFQHDKTRFKLEGKHQDVACDKCHFQVNKNDRVFIKYKIENFKCSDCH